MLAAQRGTDRLTAGLSPTARMDRSSRGRSVSILFHVWHAPIKEIGEMEVGDAGATAGAKAPWQKMRINVLQFKHVQ